MESILTLVLQRHRPRGMRDITQGLPVSVKRPTRRPTSNPVAGIGRPPQAIADDTIPDYLVSRHPAPPIRRSNVPDFRSLRESNPDRTRLENSGNLIHPSSFAYPGDLGSRHVISAKIMCAPSEKSCTLWGNKSETYHPPSRTLNDCVLGDIGMSYNSNGGKLDEELRRWMLMGI
jgi:hypothetical protein